MHDKPDENAPDGLTDDWSYQHATTWGATSHDVTPDSARYIPVTVALDLELCRTESTALWISGVCADPSGWTFDLRGAFRTMPGRVANEAMTPAPPLPAKPLSEAVDDVESLDCFWSNTSASTELPGPRSDGATVTLEFDGVTFAVPEHGIDPTDEYPQLWVTGGQSSSGGGSGSMHQTISCARIPSGPVTIVATWPARGIEAEPITIDGSAIAAAAARATKLWDDGFEPVRVIVN